MNDTIIGLFKKYKEVIMYLIFGGLTTVVSLGSYYGIRAIAPSLHYQIINTISWVIAVAFAYITNRLYVFDAKSHTAAGIVREIISFIGGRLFSYFAEWAVMAIFIDKIGWNDKIVKIVAQIIVVILNYIISKLLIFRKDKS